jgi:hypothetical protein
MAHGGAIKVHPHMHKGHHVHVTLGQKKRLMKSRISGRPITLKMTPAQFKHNVRHNMGGGFFADAWNKIKQAGKAAYNYVKPHAINLLEYGLKRARPIAEAHLKRLGAAAKDRLGETANNLVDKIEDVVDRAEKKIRGGDMLYNNPVYNTGPNRCGRSSGGSFRVGHGRRIKGRGIQSDASRLKSALRTEMLRAERSNPPTHGNLGGHIMPYNNPVYNTGPYRARGGSLEGESGGNIFGDIGDFFQHKVLPTIRKTGEIISPALGVIPGVGPIAQTAIRAGTQALKSAGYGRKRKSGGSFTVGH